MIDMIGNGLSGLLGLANATGAQSQAQLSQQYLAQQQAAMMNVPAPMFYQSGLQNAYAPAHMSQWEIDYMEAMEELEAEGIVGWKDKGV